MLFHWGRSVVVQRFKRAAKREKSENEIIHRFYTWRNYIIDLLIFLSDIIYLFNLWILRKVGNPMFSDSIAMENHGNGVTQH